MLAELLGLDKKQKNKSFPELPKIDWFTFVSRRRVRFGVGIVPASFIGYSTPEVEGTNGNWRKPKMAHKKPTKKAPMKPKKGGKKGY